MTFAGELSKENTERIKGIAIFLMVIHHTTLSQQENSPFYPIIPASSFYLEYYLCVISKLCVALFAFTSGYGLFYVNGNSPLFRPQFRRILTFMKTYWVSMIVTIVVLYIIGSMPAGFSTKQLVLAVAGFDNRLNGPWWYVGIYLLFLLCLPLTNYLLKNRSIYIFTISFLLYLISANAMNKFFYSHLSKTIFGKVVYFGPYLVHFYYWQFIIVIGYLIAKHKLFSKMYSFFNERVSQKLKIPLYSFLMIFLIIVKFAYIHFAVPSISGSPRNTIVDVLYGANVDFFMVPLFVFFTVQMMSGKNRILGFLGHHSTNIWLIHGLVILVLVKDFGFIKFYPLVLLIIVAISIIYSFFADFIVSFIKKL